tara:strand:- start:420 stop:623 length:204 start_codon:yes stop_codon:yes gene_type:complete
MFGEGLFYIKDIDISDNKLRLTMSDSSNGSHRYIFMSPNSAQEFVNKIWFTVEDYQNSIRKKVVSNG